MEATILRNFIEIQPSAGADADFPSAPERAVPRTYPGAPASRDEETIELRRILPEPPLDHVLDIPSNDAASTPEQDLEMSRSASPVSSGDGVEALQSLSGSRKNKFRFLSLCLMIFTNGLNDSAPGALIPYIEQ